MGLPEGHVQGFIVRANLAFMVLYCFFVRHDEKCLDLNGCKSNE